MSKIIIVAGYGPGISRAVAERFGRDGFKVALVGRSSERLERGAAALTAAGIEARAFPCDVAEPERVKQLVREVRAALGPISVLHWNAYVAGAGDLTRAPASELRQVFDVGLHGLVAGVQEALPDLRSERGAVLITGGGFSQYDAQVDARIVEWNAMGLAVSKAAQHKLAGLLHQKLKPEGVYVGEVVVLSLVKGTAFDAGNAPLEPSKVADAFWDLYTRRAEASTTIA